MLNSCEFFVILSAIALIGQLVTANELFFDQFVNFLNIFYLLLKNNIKLEHKY
jgi:hypothetical protein